MERHKYDLIFLVLTYRNVEDLLCFIKSVKENIKYTYKIIIVNSYYDEKTYNKCYDIANRYDCDLLNIENKGYGYGNNRGIEYAKGKYEFKFIIISNPDIEIRKFDFYDLMKLKNSIIGPKIVTVHGKKQNPYYYSKLEIVEYLKYYSAKSGIQFIKYIGIAINKIYRELRLLFDNRDDNVVKKVYALHGSFLIIGRDALDKLGIIFDERMFLFSEEEHLARLANKFCVYMYYAPRLLVIHKEDGSIKLLNKNLHRIQDESYIIYYETWKSNNSFDKNLKLMLY